MYQRKEHNNSTTTTFSSRNLILSILFLDTIAASCFVPTVHPIQQRLGRHHGRTCSLLGVVVGDDSSSISSREQKQQEGQEHFLVENDNEQITTDSDEEHDYPMCHGRDNTGYAGSITTTRRNVLRKVSSVVTASTLLVVPSKNCNLPAFAAEDAALTRPPTLRTSTSTSSSSNINCLLNLPPVAKDHARFYLCRHGQTENNRLRIVQGARVDPSINYNGRMQAIRLGEAISALKQTTKSSTIADFPTVALHSSLRRARETATVASLVAGNTGLSEEENVDFINGLFLKNDAMMEDLLTYSKGSSNSSSSSSSLMTLDTLPYLGEVDFGVVAEGQSVNEAKAKMMATFAQWAIGKIDARNGEDGETARNVLTRISLALNSMLEVAASNNGGSVMAVSHSTYLRMLLAMVMDVPLLQAASFEQKNCCINVMDVSLKETVDVTYKSNLFGGGLSSMAPRDFCLTIPKVKILRINEVGHLDDLFS